MTSTVPWKEMAIFAVPVLGVCCAIGWLTGAENLQKKKKPQRGGPAGAPGPSMEHQEMEMLMGRAEAAVKQGAFAEAERAYLRMLELIESNIDDPQVAMLPPYLYRRLIDVYEKSYQWDKCLKYCELTMQLIKGKPENSQDEMQALLSIAEKSVEIAAKHGTPQQHEKFLLIWLDIGTKLQVTEIMVVGSMFMGKLRMNQGKYTDAESYFRKCTSQYTDPAQREEMWFSCKTSQLECLTKTEQMQGAKQCIRELSDYLLNVNSDKLDKCKGLETLGDRCIFLGFYDEAEDILKATLALMKRNNTPPAELAQVDHNLAVLLSSTGRVQQARDKINEMKIYLKPALGKAIFPSHSRFLHTQSVKHDTDGTTISLYKGKDATRSLKPGSVLVIKFENPETETEFTTVEHVVQADEDTIKIVAPFNYSNYMNQIFSAEVTIYSSSEKTLELGTHFVFIPSVSTPVTPAPTAEDILKSIMSAKIGDDEDSIDQTERLEELLRTMAMQAGGDEGRPYIEDDEEGDDGIEEDFLEEDFVDGEEDDEEEEQLVFHK